MLFVCKCVLYYYHLVATQLQLKNISISKRFPFYLQQMGRGVWNAFDTLVFPISNILVMSPFFWFYYLLFHYSLSNLTHSAKIDSYVAYLFDNEFHCSPERVVIIVTGLLNERYGVRYQAVTRYFSHIPVIYSGSETYSTSY